MGFFQPVSQTVIMSYTYLDAGLSFSLHALTEWFWWERKLGSDFHVTFSFGGLLLLMCVEDSSTVFYALGRGEGWCMLPFTLWRTAPFTVISEGSLFSLFLTLWEHSSLSVYTLL